MATLFGRQRVAVVELHGVIGAGIRSQTYEPVFARVLQDRKVRALVLDIDSPGGAVAPSDYLYRSVTKVAERKSVVANIRGLGASGAYLIACAAHRIVAAHGSLVGSIGVISIRPVIEDLLNRLGVDVSVNKSGEFKDMGAFWRGATPEEERKVQDLIDDFYEMFVSIVVERRKLDEETARSSIATGEVFPATRARELDLIDEIGDLDRAIDLAVELSGAPRRPVRIRPRRSLRERLVGPMIESLVHTTAEEIERRLWMSALRY